MPAFATEVISTNHPTTTENRSPSPVLLRYAGESPWAWWVDAAFPAQSVTEPGCKPVTVIGCQNGDWREFLGGFHFLGSLIAGACFVHRGRFDCPGLARQKADHVR